MPESYDPLACNGCGVAHNTTLLCPPARGRMRSSRTPVWLLGTALALHLAAQYTWLAGIPGAEPLAALFLIACLSWNFATWVADRLAR